MDRIFYIISERAQYRALLDASSFTSFVGLLIEKSYQIRVRFGVAEPMRQYFHCLAMKSSVEIHVSTQVRILIESNIHDNLMLL